MAPECKRWKLVSSKTQGGKAVSSWTVVSLYSTSLLIVAKHAIRMVRWLRKARWIFWSRRGLDAGMFIYTVCHVHTSRRTAFVMLPRPCCCCFSPSECSWMGLNGSAFQQSFTFPCRKSQSSFCRNSLMHAEFYKADTITKWGHELVLPSKIP
jgi:hypothetical protein